MSRISACLISNDGADNMEQCLGSIAGHVDEIVIADTGMDDAGRAVCVKYGASIYQFNHLSHPAAFFMDSEEECSKFAAPGPYSNTWALGDFAAARNESFKHATGDFIVWLDSDDKIDNPEHYRVVVSEMERHGAKMAFLPYNYAQDHLGRVFYRQWRERVIRRGAAQWLNPVHEVLMPHGPPGPTPRFESPLYQHRRKADRKGIDHRNYKILLRQAWQIKAANPGAPMDPRILFYLGQEARFVNPSRAIGFYEEYLQLSGWPEERSAAHSAIGMLLEMGALGLPQPLALAQANREYAVAAAEMPENPDGLHGLARVAYARQRWQDCIRYTEQAFKIGNTDTMLGTNPMDRTYRPHVFYNYALSQVGRLEDALASCKAALAVMPDDPGIPGGASGMVTLNAKVYEAAIKKRTEVSAKAEEKPMHMFDLKEDIESPPHGSVTSQAVLIWGMQIWKQLVAAGDWERARKFLEAMPSTVTAHPVMERMFESTERRGSGRKALAPSWNGKAASVVIYTGPAPEPWDPSTPNSKGLGGSETAALEMARHLTKLGHTVVVYAEAMGTFEGVEYRHHSTFRGGVCDVFISSRAPWAVEQFGPVTATLKLLWVHDIHCGPPSPQMERWLYQYDRILCLSEWHKGFFCQTYPTVHAEQVVVTRNGIDPARFALTIPKRNNLVFSSSPNRGLDWLVSNFRYVIKPAVPDAELHVFYGFDTWETFAKQRGDVTELAEIERYRQLLPPLGTDAGGIFNHGKRPQSEVAEAYAEAKVWPYLTTFPETSCITAMEAQAAGCVPVCSRFAALAETVKHGVFIDISDQAAPQRFVENVIRLLKNEGERLPLAEAGRKYALASLSWEALAKEWSAMFDDLSKRGAEAPMWRSA